MHCLDHFDGLTSLLREMRPVSAVTCLDFDGCDLLANGAKVYIVAPNCLSAGGIFFANFKD